MKTVKTLLLCIFLAQFSGAATANPNVKPAECENSVKPSEIRYGYNVVVDGNGRAVRPQGRPFQNGYRLKVSGQYIKDHNTREYAQVFSIIGQLREALACGLEGVSKEDWLRMTDVLRINGIKTTQNLTGSPRDRFYSSDGIYDHAKRRGPDLHPMMRYLEEAELELKCLALKGFNFRNPEGVNHCQEHSLKEGSGIKMP